MSNSIFQGFIKRRKKVVAGKLKLVAGLPYNVANNINLRDLFTLVLFVITLIVLILV